MGAANPPRPQALRVLRRSQRVVRARGPELRPPLGSLLPLPVLDSRTLPGHLPVLYLFPAASPQRGEEGAGQEHDVAQRKREGVGGPSACAAGILRSLELALALYAPLAGRLVWADRVKGERRMAILCNNAGGLLVEVECGQSMRSELGDNLRDPHCLPPGLTCAPAPALLVPPPASARSHPGPGRWTAPLAGVPRAVQALCSAHPRPTRLDMEAGVLEDGVLLGHGNTTDLSPCCGVASLRRVWQANVRDPLMTVQLTSFRCGGVVLAVSFHHFVTDGSGFFNFMAAWAALARSCGALPGEPSGTPWGSPWQGIPTPWAPPGSQASTLSTSSGAPSPERGCCPGASRDALEPSHERHLLAARERPADGDLKPASPGWLHPLGTPAAAARLWALGPAAAFLRAALFLMRLLLQCARAPAVSSACFHLSAEQLRALKARTLRCPSLHGEAPKAHHGETLGKDSTEAPKAHHGETRGKDSTEASTASQAAPWASTDDVLCALLWQVMTAARGLGVRQQAGTLVSFRRAVDIRSRLEPPLPKAYFGNAVLGAPTDHLQIPAAQLVGMPTAELAYQLRAQLSKVDEEYCRDFCSMAAPATALDAIISPTVGRGTVISSWMKFDLYLDFGFGAPEHVCVAYGEKPKFVAGMTVLQPSRAPGGVDITVVLPEPQADRMRHLLAARLRKGQPSAPG